MGKLLPIFQKKIIKKKSSKALFRNFKPKKKTKAVLKKEFIAQTQKAIEHLEIFNRITMVGEKLTHLKSAMAHLEKCLEHHPGNHHLRIQQKICKEGLFFLEKIPQKSADNVIEILISKDLL